MNVDNRLVRAVCEGTEVLPEDLTQLHAYLKLIAGLLAESAVQHEPNWWLLLAASAEVETLQNLEELVARKAARVQARTLGEVITKLAIWQALESGGEEADEVPVRDAIVHSARLDLERLVRGPPGRVRRTN